MSYILYIEMDGHVISEWDTFENAWIDRERFYDGEEDEFPEIKAYIKEEI
jgi:hypothetical protein